MTHDHTGRCTVLGQFTILLHLLPSSQSLARPVQRNISICITTAYNMADTEQKMVEEVPAAQEEEGQEPKVGTVE